MKLTFNSKFNQIACLFMHLFLFPDIVFVLNSIFCFSGHLLMPAGWSIESILLSQLKQYEYKTQQILIQLNRENYL